MLKIGGVYIACSIGNFDFIADWESMSDKKISELTLLSTPVSDDYIPINDVSDLANSPKRATLLSLTKNITGPTTIGDGGVTDYSAFSSEGAQTYHGSARFWQGIFIDTSRFKEPPANKATLVNRGIGTAYEFSDNQDSEHVHVQVRIPGFWDETEGLQVIILWDSVTTSQNCDWEIGYQFMAVNETMDSEALDGTESDLFESSSVSKGLVHSTIVIPAASFSAEDKFFRFKLYRDGDDVNDTLGASAYVHGIIVRGVRNKTGGSL